MSKALAGRRCVGILPLSLCCICILLAMSVQPLYGEAPVQAEDEESSSEEPWPEEIRAGAERVDAHTIRYTGESFWSVFHHHFYGQPEYPLPE